MSDAAPADYTAMVAIYTEAVRVPNRSTELLLFPGTRKGCEAPEIEATMVVKVDGVEILRVPASALPRDVIDRLFAALRGYDAACPTPDWQKQSATRP